MSCSSLYLLLKQNHSILHKTTYLHKNYTTPLINIKKENIKFHGMTPSKI